MAAPVEEVCECEEGAKVYLFATKTCPNCKIAGEFLDKAGIAYEKLFADEHLDLVSQYGIKQAPTLVVIQNGEISKHIGVSDIKKMLNA